jgi:hypothetical protein
MIKQTGSLCWTAKYRHYHAGLNLQSRIFWIDHRLLGFQGSYLKLMHIIAKSFALVQVSSLARLDAFYIQTKLKYLLHIIVEIWGISHGRPASVAPLF